ncbi:hypothetical protein JTB14_027852 [Gonioctena quinquepunctata]|nr:hypothetical protein JTB14_027852 [Gonioctena quinquepunctata]
MSAINYLVFSFHFYICGIGLISGDDMYHLGTDPVTAGEATRKCQNKNLELVTIEDEEKNKAISEFLKEQGAEDGYWTSGHKCSEESFVWLEGDTVQYTNWEDDETAEGLSPGSCIGVTEKDDDLKWSGQKCCDKKGYICENPRCNRTVLTKEYFVSDTKLKWGQARNKCSEMDMQLVKIPDMKKNKVVHEWIREKGNLNWLYWTSGRGGDMPWQWEDGELIHWFRWQKRQPDNKKYRCCIEVKETKGDLRWNDHFCSTKRFFICESKGPQITES